MKPLAVALVCALIGGGAYAKDAEGCMAAADAVRPDIAMPRVAAAIMQSPSLAAAPPRVNAHISATTNGLMPLLPRG